jgi:hypothetical protein
MSYDSDTNGPWVHPVSPNEALPGMTLRDYFASGVVSATMSAATGLGEMTITDRTNAFKIVAQIGYEMADAMLEARK